MAAFPVLYVGDIQRTIQFYTSQLDFVVEWLDDESTAPRVSLRNEDVNLIFEERPDVQSCCTGEILMVLPQIDELVSVHEAAGNPVKLNFDHGFRSFRVVDADGYCVRVAEVFNEFAGQNSQDAESERDSWVEAESLTTKQTKKSDEPVAFNLLDR